MSDTNQYDIEAPQGISVDPRIIPAFQKFYSYADDPTAHEQFANSWTPDGSYISGSIKAHGRDRVLELRRFSHEKTPIKKRFHYPQKLFVHGDNNLDTMLYGHMRFLLKDGAELEIEWGARALFEEHEGNLKFKIYQSYIVSLSCLQQECTCFLLLIQLEGLLLTSNIGSRTFNPF